jgi:hypothetical protein
MPSREWSGLPRSTVRPRNQSRGGRLRGRHISAGKCSLSGDVVVPDVAVLSRDVDGSVEALGDSKIEGHSPLR